MTDTFKKLGLALEAGDFAKARDLLMREVKKPGPDQARHQHNLGLIFEQLGSQTKAMYWLKQAFQHGHQRCRAGMELIRLHLQDGGLDEAHMIANDIAQDLTDQGDLLACYELAVLAGDEQLARLLDQRLNQLGSHTHRLNGLKAPIGRPKGALPLRPEKIQA